MLTGKHIYQYA